MMAWAKLLLFLFVPVAAQANVRVRHVQVKGDQIVTVKTALGVATIIQVPDKPNSVVVGDQEAFKIEYLDQAVTIKPLHGRAKSNLYIYTDWRRFNAQLVTGGELEADYIVYLESASAPSNGKAEPPRRGTTPGLRWTALRRRMTSDELVFEVKRLGRTPDGLLVIEFSITATKPATVKPAWLWLTQAKLTRPIQGLYLSGVELKPGASVHGMIQMLRRDIDEAAPVRVELRRKKTSFLTLPGVASWK